MEGRAAVETVEAIGASVSALANRTVREMAVTAEIAGVLTISERAAGALLFEAGTLAAELPPQR